MWLEVLSHQPLKDCWASSLSWPQWCFAECLLAGRSARAGLILGQAFTLEHRL